MKIIRPKPRIIQLLHSKNEVDMAIGWQLFRKLHPKPSLYCFPYYNALLYRRLSLELNISFVAHFNGDCHTNPVWLKWEKTWPRLDKLRNKYENR